MITPSMRTLNESFDMAAEELDYLLGRVCRNDPVLRLERDSDMWIVVDDRNDAIMLRTEYPTCVRFAVAFVAKHPEASLDGSFGLVALKGSGGEPQAIEVSPAPLVSPAVAREPASPPAHAGDERAATLSPASPDVFSRAVLADVIELRPVKGA